MRKLGCFFKALRNRKMSNKVGDYVSDRDYRNAF